MKALGFLLFTVALHAAPSIPNPSFEANAVFTVFPGYINGNSPINGWTASDPGRVGLNPGATFSPFSDNGAIPDGSRVAFIQSLGSTTTLSTTITGLTKGKVYHLKFRANARSNPTFPTGSYRINGEAPSVFFVRPVGGANAYITIGDFFTATGTTATLEISNTTPGDSTLLVDAFSIEAATPLVVTNTNDSGPGSLRATLDTADGTPAFNIITFAPALNGGTITLDSQLAVNDASGMAIDASGLSNGLTIDGGDNDYRIFDVSGAATRMYLRRLTLTRGNEAVNGGYGGAILLSEGSLTLQVCSLVDNIAAFGGAIYSEGSLTLRSCTVSENSAIEGGGILTNTNLTGKSATFIRCTIVGNIAAGVGGGIENGIGHTFLSHCTISGNSADVGDGAGVASAGISNTETVVDRCIITGNAHNSDVDLVVDTLSNSFTSGGRNIIGGGDATADFNVNDLTGQNAQLSVLANNGGPTKTMAIAPSSPARNAAVGSVITTDQRGRPLFGGADAGAFELQSGTFSLSASAYRVREGEPAVITIKRGADIADFTTVRLVTKPGTATAADITPRADDNSSNIDFAENEASMQVSIPTTADLLLEGDHSFTVELSLFGVTDGSAIVTAPITATVTIADPIQVTTTADDGPGSLRQAFRTAAAVSGPDTIHFSPKLNGQTITFGSEIQVNDTGGVVVDASSLPMGLTLDGAGYSRLFYVANPVGTPFTLRGLTLTGGNGTGVSSGSGGAIRHLSGTLNLERCTLFGNSVQNATGGAIYNASTAVLTQCTLSGNSAPGVGVAGGAIANAGNLTLTHCTLASNSTDGSGGGIFNFGSVSLNRSIVSGNTAAAFSASGDLFNTAPSGVLNVEGTSFSPLLQNNGTLNGSGTISTSDPQLAPLADNGGPTMTHALLPNSPARDAGTGSTFTKDQRGVSIIDTPDVGAFEVDLGGVFAFNQKGYLGYEGQMASITVTRSGGFSDSCPVTLTVVPGSASGADHTLTTQTLNFADGEVSKTVNFTCAGMDGNEPDEFFTVKLSVSGPGTSLGAISTAKIYIVDESAISDTTPPSTTKILSPKANAAVGVDVGGAVTISGTASDNRGVRYVNVFNALAVFITTVTVDFPGAKTSTWSTKLTPSTGANTFIFSTGDSRQPVENQSTLTPHNFKVLRPLLVNISGFGSVTKGYFPKSYREVGKPHSLTATPGSGYLFAGWTILSGHSAGDIGVTLNALQLPTLNFIQREGLVLRANFALSPFTPQVAGTYTGFIAPNVGGVYALDSLGHTTIKVQSNGAFTGTLKLDGDSIPLSGIFDSAGVARFGASRQEIITHLRKDKPALQVTLGIDISPPLAGEIMGGIRILQSMPRNLFFQAQLCPYSKTNPVPSSYLGANGTDGIYTAVIMPKPNAGFNDDEYPQGTGFFTTKISRTGTITMKGELADGTAFSMTTLMQIHNNWTLFSSLYGARGLLLGVTGPPVPDPTFDFTMVDSVWIRPVLDTQHYAAGWPESIRVDVGGAKYTATAGTSIVPGLPGTGNATLQFSSATLGLNQFHPMLISPADIATPAAGLRIKIDRKTGIFSGTFDYGSHPGVPYKGIILNKEQTNTSPCQGYFLSPTPKVKDYTGQSGAVNLMR
ncbi:MAG: hypothetical protein JNJ83_16255 [Verrucomicrobiaceae bacterium]|nr:hypothetical protein [Verrucomicrobiaceae bacterium]